MNHWLAFVKNRPWSQRFVPIILKKKDLFLHQIYASHFCFAFRSSNWKTCFFSQWLFSSKKFKKCLLTLLFRIIFSFSISEVLKCAKPVFSGAGTPYLLGPLKFVLNNIYSLVCTFSFIPSQRTVKYSSLLLLMLFVNLIITWSPVVVHFCNSAYR